LERVPFRRGRVGELKVTYWSRSSMTGNCWAGVKVSGISGGASVGLAVSREGWRTYKKLYFVFFGFFFFSFY